MCGIAGFWSTRPLSHTARKELTRMTEVLYHRGPDGYGYHLDKEAGLAMGHARLSIIDLEGGEQPLFSQDRKQILTVNGEFYDYKTIRTRLRLDGASFSTKSDSEIALPLYDRHGLDFVQHLRGEYGGVLYDREKDRMMMLRDRFGVKPLFYRIHNGTLYWGSEAKAILAHSDVEAKLDARAGLHQMMHTMIPGTSAFEGVHAVKPGHLMIIQKRGDGFEVREKKYWDMDFPEEQDRDLSVPTEKHIEAVQETLLDAVRTRLEADVPVGCYLSGGIDSCAMLGLASSMQQSSVKAFTISFDHDAYDESPIAREMAEKTNADQELLKLTASELYGDNYLRTVWHAERTFYNTLGVAKWCMSKRVHECGYKVVVTGEGSDELFGGYPAFKRDMLRFGHKDSDPGQVKAYQELMEKTNSLFKGAILSEDYHSHPAMEDICGFTPSWVQPWMQTLEIVRPLLSDAWLEELEGYDPIAAIAESFDQSQINGRHYLDIAQYTWSKTMLECQILNWGGDRVDMANSMESRPAFLDHHVAAVAVQIPPHLRIKGNIEKWVLREAMKNILPEVLYKREKFAFMAPPGHTESRKKLAVDDLIDNYLRERALHSAGVFDAGRVGEFLTGYRSDTDAVSLVRKDAILNHLLGLQVLHSQYREDIVPV